MKFFQVKSASEAINLIDSYVLPIEGVEMLPIMQANGRILAEDILSVEQTPAFMRSSVDGYAVKAADTYGSSESMPGFLNITGEIKMGEAAYEELQFGEAVYVPTGGMMPPGSDAMVMIEHCENHHGLLSVYKQTAPMENVIQAGEDYQKGIPLLEKGIKLRPQELGALASQGITEIPVYRKPRIAYLSTGDEIVSYEDKNLPLAKVRDMNAITIGTTVMEMGGDFVFAGIIPDNRQALEEACHRWLAESDCLVLSGGSSVGTKDYSVEVIESLGDPGVYVHGLSVKPGKPTILASAAGKPVIGLPGHPASAMVIFSVFGKEIMDRLTGSAHRSFKQVFAKADKRIASSVGRTDYVRVKLRKSGSEWRAEPVLGKSGLISTLVNSDGLLVIPEAKEGVEQDETVSVLLLR